ncbi:MAG: hypothetical protein HC863_01590 [Myxococcales bacterium]|nr:hypothetical protein [Myxococcales bacterium]
MRSHYWDAGRSASFAATTDDERATLRRVLPKILDAATRTPPGDVRSLAPELSAVGLSLEAWTMERQTFWAIREAASAIRGAGLYLIRVAPAKNDGGRPSSEIILQAPHDGFDLHTGPIALAMFVAPTRARLVRMLFVNSIPRYAAAPGRQKPERGATASDVAHNPDHLFTAVTVAAAAALDKSIVIQLHGFEIDSAPADTVAIVSASSREHSSATSTAVAEHLRAVLGEGVLRFPEDISGLGGTRNAQAKALSGLGVAFVHLELSKELRARLAKQPKLAAQLLGAITDPEVDPRFVEGVLLEAAQR